MRCTIISKGNTLPEIEDLIKSMGATNIRVAPRSGQIFCDMTEDAIKRLQGLPGLTTRIPGRLRVTQYGDYQHANIYTATGNEALAAFLDQARTYLNPLTLGGMWKVAVLDTGVRSSHIMLRDKIIYEKNFSSSPAAEDVHDHGTAVAALIAGNQISPSGKQGFAPGAQLLNIKVIGDDGNGEEEDVVMGIEEAIAQGAKIINLSFGGEDKGDSYNPVRLACQAAYEEGVIVNSSVGNYGPGVGTVMSPACDEKVWAVGSLAVNGNVSTFSGRGPTRQGLVKPDMMFYGEGLLLPSSASDDAFVAKTGTSFACAGISGFTALLQEQAVRIFGRELTQVENWDIAMHITRKPYTVVQPPSKDTEYGWGMPCGDLAAQVVRPAVGESVSVAAVVAAVLPLVGIASGIALVGSAVGTAIREVRRGGK